LKFLKKEDVDIVVTDLKMAEMGGMEFLDHIRKHYPEIVSVVITGYASIASVVETMKLGAFDYLPKPFTPDEFINLIEKRGQKEKSILKEEIYF